MDKKINWTDSTEPLNNQFIRSITLAMISYSLFDFLAYHFDATISISCEF